MVSGEIIIIIIIIIIIVYQSTLSDPLQNIGWLLLLVVLDILP